jgi:hypothetical protein
MAAAFSIPQMMRRVPGAVRVVVGLASCFPGLATTLYRKFGEMEYAAG